MYCIEVIGYTRRRYCIKRVVNGLIIPVDGKAYKTEDAAKKAAAALGLIIEKTGCVYDIV